MNSLDEHNTQQWLRAKGWIEPNESVQVVRLTGGVSNDVFRVCRKDADDFVLKQARGQLRVAEVWKCSIERIWRERDVLETLSHLLGPIDWCAGINCVTPRLLHQCWDDYVIAITAASADNVTWKQELLAGRISVDVARACGRLLGTIHGKAWDDEAIQVRFADRSFFDALRIDPYYRHVARSREDLAPIYQRLEQSLGENRRTLVHGDFSPKNLLVDSGSVMLLDFEVGHFGDPAFDLGFFLTHLTLKLARAFDRQNTQDSHALVLAIQAFCSEYSKVIAPVVGDEDMRLWERTHLNWAACGLARIDGKSPVDYLHDDLDAMLRSRFARLLSAEPAKSLPDVADRFVEAVTG